MLALADSCIGSRVGGNGVRSSGVDGTLGLGTTGGGSAGAVGVRASSGVSSGPFGTCRVQVFKSCYAGRSVTWSMQQRKSASVNA